MLTIKGMPELIQNLRDLEVHIPDALASAGMFAMTENVETVAKERAPIDTGRLKADIHTMVIEKNQKAVTVQTGTNLIYAPYVEFGTGRYAAKGNGRQTPWTYLYRGHKGRQGYRVTRGQRPQPFLTPALQMNANRIPDSIAMRLNQIIEEAARNRKMSALANYYGG